MGSVTPVMYRASSEARNSTALEMSRASTHGGTGWRAGSRRLSGRKIA